MKKFTRAISVLLILALAVSLLSVTAMAKGQTGTVAEKDPVILNDSVLLAETVADNGGNLSRAEVYSRMGYNFPEEGDTTVPKYKLIYPDGKEEIRYDLSKMADDTKTTPSGTTLVLLSDIYESTTYIENNLVSSIGCAVGSGRTFNFDFAGYTILTEHKKTFFEVANGGVLNIYSSIPGAKLVMGVERKTTGGSIITVSTDGTANIGDFGEYPGENLSTYSAGGYGVTTRSKLTVKGVNIYRVFTDYVGFFTLSGHNAEVLFERCRAFGVGRYLQIACREDITPGAAYSNTMLFKDCVLSNIGSKEVTSGQFFRYIADDNVINFEHTIFDQVSFSCQKYYSHDNIVDLEGNKLLPCQTAQINLDKYCSYNQVPDVISLKNQAETSDKAAMFHFPELAEGYGEKGSTVPEYILTDGLVTNVCSMVVEESVIKNGYMDLTIRNLTEEGEDISGMFALPYLGYEEDVVQVTWNFEGASSSTDEYWIKGVTPIPYRLNVPDDTDYIKYVIECDYSDDDIALYTISPEVNVTLKCNFNFAKEATVNVYVPDFEDFPINEFVYRMSIAGTVVRISDILENSETVMIDGLKYYKVSVSIPYSRITDTMYISVDVANATATSSAFTASKKIDFASLLIDYCNGDGTDEFKNNVREVLWVIYKNSTSPLALPKIAAYVEEYFKSRLEEEKAAAEKGQGGFLDGILNAFK
ncbi:MAG: hypothetical protein IKC87_06675 [Clostridia bacterium]|nr:hypothetical protein [Clostridia bacterium]